MKGKKFKYSTIVYVSSIIGILIVVIVTGISNAINECVKAVTE